MGCINVRNGLHYGYNLGSIFNKTKIIEKYFKINLDIKTLLFYICPIINHKQKKEIMKKLIKTTTFKFDTLTNAFRPVQRVILTSLDKALIIGAISTGLLLFTVYQLLLW